MTYVIKRGGDATAFVKTTVDTILARANAAPGSIKAGSTQAVDIAETLIGPHLDLDAASKRILGTAWRDADDGQKQRFATTFRSMTVNLFASAVPGFPGAVVEVVPQD